MDITFGNVSAVEYVALDHVHPADPLLQQKWEAAVAAGKVTGDPVLDENNEVVSYTDPADDMKAARLSAVKTMLYLSGCQETSVSAPDQLELLLGNIKAVMAWHLAPGTNPAWVEAADPAVASLLAGMFSCPVGRPEGWEVGAPVPAAAPVEEGGE